MMGMAEAAQAIGAERRGGDAVFTGVSSDSRALARGDLFVALRGERFDGHDFVTGAADSGAAGALVAADTEPRFADSRLPLLMVP
ncbi:MAG TPA: Mur ligase domain-containing protein, partial [Burkholderiales bacterium]|nr:Mur ligase domain-containing protein [Burkholderiales bacterium]